MSKFDWTKIMLCGLRNTKNMGYTEVSLEQKNLLLTFNTSFTEKSRFQRSIVQFSLIAQLFLWDQCHLVQLPNSVEFSLIEIQCNWVWLTMPGLIKSWIFASIIEMKWFVSCYRFNTMYTKHARKFWSPLPMWVSECIHTPLYRREYLFLTVALLPFGGDKWQSETHLHSQCRAL